MTPSQNVVMHAATMLDESSAPEEAGTPLFLSKNDQIDDGSGGADEPRR